MKLLTLLTTLIITLASSNMFAQTFACENWKYDGIEEKGSLFVGEKIDDTISIKSVNGIKRTYTFLGNTIQGSYYTAVINGYTNIIMVGTKEVVVDLENAITMDFSIELITDLDEGWSTLCNWNY